MALKDVLDMVVNYGLPSVAIAISAFSLHESRKATKVQLRLNKIEEKLKKYELEEKEKEREAADKAVVEVRIYNISKGKYRLKFWNSGQATAYNVDYIVPEEIRKLAFRDKVPFETLESGKSFEEHIVVHFGMPSKFLVKTMWEDSEGKKYEREQLVTY